MDRLVHSGVRRARNIQTNQLIMNNICFKTENPTDLKSFLQYKIFDISHSFWGLMVAENRCLLVTVASVIFPLASRSVSSRFHDPSMTSTFDAAISLLPVSSRVEYKSKKIGYQLKIKMRSLIENIKFTSLSRSALPLPSAHAASVLPTQVGRDATGK